MERESDSAHTPGRRHGREHDPLEESVDELDQETVPLEDIGREPGENVPIDDI